MMVAHRAVSIAQLAVGGSPWEFVEASAGAKFQAVNIRICARRPNEPYPHRPLLNDEEALRSLRFRASDVGVRIASVSVYQLYPEVHWATLAPVVDAAAVLGAGRIMINGFDAEAARFEDRFARVCEAAAERAIQIALEFMPYSAVRSLDQALGILERVDANNAGLVIDSLHLARSGLTPADLVRVPPGRLAVAQLCDADDRQTPMSEPELMAEARSGRRSLGHGALPLRELLDAIPANLELEYEVAQASLAQKTPNERAVAARADVDRFLSTVY